MADCVHIGCQDYISCRRVSGRTGTDVGKCEHCGLAVVFVPADILWVASSGRVPDDKKAICDQSPTNQHWVAGK